MYISVLSACIPVCKKRASDPMIVIGSQREESQNHYWLREFEGSLSYRGACVRKKKRSQFDLNLIIYGKRKF